jgi:hypothetical protein
LRIILNLTQTEFDCLQPDYHCTGVFWSSGLLGPSCLFLFSLTFSPLSLFFFFFGLLRSLALSHSLYHKNDGHNLTQPSALPSLHLRSLIPFSSIALTPPSEIPNQQQQSAGVQSEGVLQCGGADRRRRTGGDVREILRAGGGARWDFP